MLCYQPFHNHVSMEVSAMNSQAPRTLRELANAYYNDKKTTIGAGEPLSALYAQARALPYFVAASSQTSQNGQICDRNYDFKLPFPGKSSLTGYPMGDFMAAVKAMATQQGVPLSDCTLESLSANDEADIRLHVELRYGASVEDFAQFAKGLGILLRAATQDKREEAYNTAPAPAYQL